MKVLITGASSGIGLEMTKYLNKLGYELLVVSTNKERLDNIYKNLNIKVKSFEFDLSKEENCYKLYDTVKKEKIDILINNAGFGDAGKFVETSLDKELNMIKPDVDRSIKFLFDHMKLSTNKREKQMLEKNYERLKETAREFNKIIKSCPDEYKMKYLKQYKEYIQEIRTNQLNHSSYRVKVFKLQKK